MFLCQAIDGEDFCFRQAQYKLFRIFVLIFYFYDVIALYKSYKINFIVDYVLNIFILY